MFVLVTSSLGSLGTPPILLPEHYRPRSTTSYFTFIPIPTLLISWVPDSDTGLASYLIKMF
eukprot:1252544-Pyramimonas_sp.AAC.1